MNKKGNITDMPFIVLMLFFLGISIIIALFLIHSINAGFSDANAVAVDADNNTYNTMDAALNVTQAYETKSIPLWDGIFLTVFVALALAAIISAYFIDANPIMFPVSVILIIIFIIFTNIMESVFATFTAESGFSSFAEQFTIMPFFMNHLTAIITILAFVIAIVLYSKFRSV